jgi:hypothetical protein
VRGALSQISPVNFMTYITGAVSAPSGLANGIARNESRRVGPRGEEQQTAGPPPNSRASTGGGQNWRAAERPRRVQAWSLKQWLTATNLRRKLLHRMVLYYSFSGKVPGTGWRLPSFLLARQRLKHRRGRHVDFAVYARLRRRGLSGCGGRDDGARRTATPAPVAILRMAGPERRAAPGRPQFFV